MQCPNCHKEAINVNGKYVCLDCGIEISADQTNTDNQTEQPTVPPSINIENHAPQFDTAQVEPDQSQPIIQTEPIAPVVPQNDTSLQENYISADQPNESDIKTPVRDEIQKEIEQASDTPSFNTPVEQDNSPKIPIPDFPSSVGSNPKENTPNLDVIPNDGINSAQVVEEKQNSEHSEEITPQINQSQINESQPQQITNDQTTEPSNDNSQTQQPIANNIQTDVQTINEESPVAINPTESSIKPDMVQDVPQTVQTPIQPTPENYFQPQSMNITPNNQPTNMSGVDPNFDTMSTPSGIGAGEPMISPAEANPMVEPTSNIAPTIEPPTQNIQMPAENSASNQLDNLLDAYSTPITPGITPQPTQPPIGSFDTVQSATPNLQQNEKQPGQVPSYESVFGSSNEAPQTVNQTPQPVAQKFNLLANKKMLLIIGGAILGLILLIGIIFAVINSSKEQPAEQNQSIIDQELSTNVQNAMEGEINAIVTFEQTLDFKDINLLETSDPEKTSAEAYQNLIKTPSTNKGVWKVNSTGNTELLSTVNSIPDKKIYVSEDDASFSYNQTTDSWDRNDGFLINSVPSFYGAESRGKLFYMAQVESFENLGQEEVKGTTYDKFKIVPKVEFIESIIAQSNPLLAETVYNSINLDSLEILAWLNKDGKIYKVTVKGSVEVETDDFNGSINITSTASYDYKDELEIKKPVAVKIIEPVAENITQSIVQKDTEVKPIETTIIKASDKYGGKG